MARRLQKELKRMTDPKTKGYENFQDIRDSCTISLPDEANIMKWVVKMKGPKESLYENGVFTLVLEFPSRYPHKAPDVQNSTPILHPNTDSTGKEWCRDLWAANWGPTLDSAYVLRAIRSVMIEPNLDTPVNAEFCEIWNKDKKKASEMIDAHIAKHADA